MAHLRVEVDGNTLFDGDVDGWQPPPALPPNLKPGAGKGVQSLPLPVRQALAQALTKALEQATGFHITVNPS